MTLLMLVATINSGAWASAADHFDGQISVYVLATFPERRPATLVNERGVSSTFTTGMGGGVKVALFPYVAHGMLGAELEHLAHHTRLGITPSMRTAGGRADLMVSATMINLLARWPHGPFRPYGGIGIGYAQGLLVNPNFPGRSDTDFAGTAHLAHQFLAGLQVTLTPSTFLFGEYKYFDTTYRWPGLAIDVRSHGLAAGVGLRF